MPEFKRIKVRAILESDVMLVTWDQVEGIVAGVSAKLQDSGLTLVSVEPEEITTAPTMVPAAYDD